MDDLAKRIANLPPEKRKLLEAKLLAQRQAAKASSAIPKREEKGPAVLSSSQRRLWFLDRFEPGNTVYNIPMLLKLEGPLNVARLEQAISSIIERHEVLRTTFSADGENPVQVVHPAAPVTVEAVAVTEADASGAVRELARLPFSLSEGPLIRFSLLSLNNNLHWLLVTAHHIVSDGWSHGVFQSELVHTYSGAPSDLPPLPIQYADYATWREHSDGEHQGQVDYWLNKLGDSPPVLDLPADRPRPAQRNYAGARLKHVIPANLAEPLKAVTKAKGSTVFMALLAVLNVLFARYSGQNDICIGSPVAGRNRTELEKLIGVFINTLVLRNNLDGDPSFSQLLDQVRATTLEAFSNQDVPFEKLIEELQPERNTSHSPLFQVMLVLQNQDQAATRMGEVNIERDFVEMGSAMFELTFIAYERIDGIHLTIEYSTELFDRTTIERLTGHLDRLIEGFISQPDAPISNIRMLSPQETDAILAASNHAPVAGLMSDNAGSKGTACINDLFQAQAEQTPDATALSFKGASITYGELLKRVNQLANHLSGLGVGPDVLVPIMANRSPDMIIGQLAILAAGGAYVPLDPAYPKDRLEFALEDCAASVVLIQDEVRDKLPESSASIVSLDDTSWRNGPDTKPDVTLSADNLAYVIYTSGSTGKPKGVLITHANVTRLLSATQHWFGFNEKDVWTFFHSFAFDFSVWEIFGALTTGGKLVIVPYDVSRDPALFYRLMVDQGVTVLNQTPSAFRQLVAVEDETGADSALNLRVVIFGGEALEPVTLKPWVEKHGDDSPQLINMYGITETTVHVTYRRITKTEIDEGSSSVIGVPIPDLSLYILDPAGNLVPTGVAGEMYVGGLGVAKGYLNRSALNVERFIPNPFDSNPQARLYRTGDLARRRSDGELEYLGRIDLQVKVRGYRIELGEIETNLSDLDQVQEVTVMCREDTPGDQRLVAYIVPAPGANCTESELRKLMHQRLPTFMVPSHFVTLESLPLTANGKVDKKSLPAPATSHVIQEDTYVAPQTPEQEKLAAIWADVLGIEKVGIRDNFFDLGGHSLLALRLVSKIENETGRRIPLIDLFQGRSIEDMTARSEDSARELASEISAIRASGSLTPFFAIGSHPLFVDVAKRVNPEQPFYRLDVYALQSKRMAQGFKTYSDVDNVTQEFTDAIQSIQPKGPYILGGGCEGALTAFSVATELQQRGEQVAMLVLWITPAPHYGGGSVFGRSAAFRVVSQLRALAGHIRLSDLNWRTFVELAKHEYIEYRIFRSMDNYQPKHQFAGKIILARTVENRKPWDTDLAMGWGEHTSEGVEVHEIPGNHDTWLKIHKESFGDLLESFLARVRTGLS